MEDEKSNFLPNGKRKKELVKKDIPNVVLLPNLKKKLKKLLGITGNLYFTKRRFAHTNPVTKAKHSNQNFRIEEYKGNLKWIKNSTYAFVVTLKKIEVKALINKNYELVGAGVEPAISLALSKRPTTLTSSATNSDKTITSMEESVNNNLGRRE